jgi:CheY-like chemotaxis protein
MLQADSRYRALIVDDEDLVREFLGQMLEHLGCEVVHSVPTSAEALKLMDVDGSGNIAFVDINLETKDGGLIVAKRAAAVGMDVVVITGGAHIPDGAPGNALLIKPFSVEHLRAVLETLAKGPRKR